MATLVECHSTDGQVYYVNLDQMLHMHATEEGGTAFRFIGGDFLVSSDPPEHFLGRKSS